MGLEPIFKCLCKCHSERVIINLWYPFWASTLSLSLKLGVNRPLTDTKESGLYMRNTYSVIVIALYRWAWRNNFIDISVSELPSFSILPKFRTANLPILCYSYNCTFKWITKQLISQRRQMHTTPTFSTHRCSSLRVSFRWLLRFRVNLYPTMTH